MVERVRPVAQLLLVRFLRFAALVKRVAEIVMAFTLETSIPRQQRLTE